MSEEFTYLQTRLDKQAKWHAEKGAVNKRRFYTSEIIALIAGALIPILNVVNLSADWQIWQRVGSTLLASIIVIATGVGKLINYRENWLSYRGLAEALQREKEFYLNGVGDYENRQEAGRRRLLVRRTEEILSSTTTRFISLHRADREKPQDAPKT